jgi:hypothetical protein
MTSKVFKPLRFVYFDIHHVMVQLWNMSLLNRSGICDGIICCNICFVHTAVYSLRTAFNSEKIYLLFRIIILIQWSIIFCRPCCHRFMRLKYIPRLFSEYMLTFMAERPMKICVTCCLYIYLGFSVDCICSYNQYLIWFYQIKGVLKNVPIINNVKMGTTWYTIKLVWRNYPTWYSVCPLQIFKEH